MCTHREWTAESIDISSSISSCDSQGVLLSRDCSAESLIFAPKSFDFPFMSKLRLKIFVTLNACGPRIDFRESVAIWKI